MKFLRFLLSPLVLLVQIQLCSWVALAQSELSESSEVQQLQVYGYVPGYDSPQPLDYAQVEKIKTWTHESIPTWLALVTDLDTPDPKLHIIDTAYFKGFPSKYGIHQAYAQQMGLVSGPVDFIERLKADNRARSIMPYTFYVPSTKVMIDGVEAQWVLQNRRYIFKDSSTDFAASLQKAENVFREKMGALLYKKPFFITYRKVNSTRRPNLKTTQGLDDIQALKDLGYNVVAEDEMATQVGKAPASVSVHNKNLNNQAFGYLKVINTEDELQDLTPHHIAIFPSLPDRVPPVGAIVTLESQTELSHINVLAINRGTLNVAVSDQATGVLSYIINMAKQYDEKPVKFEVKGDFVEIQLASDGDVAKFQEQIKTNIGQVEIPRIVLGENTRVRKASVLDSPATLGAKAANYGKIERLLGSKYVKPGYAIGFNLYRSIVTEGGANSIEKRIIIPFLDNLKRGQVTPREVYAELSRIREAISQVRLPSDTVSSLEDLANGGYSHILDNDKIRFRSSTNCEDLPRFNGAGLYLSEGIKIKHLRQARSNPNSMKKLHKDLLLVVGSLWLPQAFWEREYFSIDHMQAGMAIQINPSFGNESANGVIVASQINGATNFWVNTQYGEASVTNPEPGEIPESIKFSTSATDWASMKKAVQEASLKVHSLSNLGSIFLDQESKVNPVNVDLLVELLTNTQKVLGQLIPEPDKFGVDIEFKLMKENGVDKLYLKQARPLNLTLSH